MSAPTRTWTTPGRLRGMAGLLVVATVATGISAGIVIYSEHSTVGAVQARTAPAAVAVQVARASLAGAHEAVVASFLTGTARLAGPGQRYQDGITEANHALAQLAEHYAGDVEAGQRLQFLNAMLVTYLGLVTQADTAHRIAGATGADYDLGLVYLWNATKLLHDPNDGILSLFDALGKGVDRELAGQADTGWFEPVALVGPAVLATGLLGLLSYAQLFLFRRFRRAVNPALALATLVLFGTAGWATVTVAETNQQYRSALDAHAELVDVWRVEAASAAAGTESALSILLPAPCDGEERCQATVAETLAALPLADPELADPVDQGDPAEPPGLAAQRSFNADIAAAGDFAGLRVGVPVATVVIAGLVLLGFKPRLDEYRG